MAAASCPASSPPPTSSASWARPPRSARWPARPGTTAHPRQPYGRQYVARLAPDGRLVRVEPRLNDETLAKIIPNTTRGEQVRDLLGPPWQAAHYARLERSIWTWSVHRWGNVGLPAQLNVQLSQDGVVREVLIIDEFPRDGNLRH